MKKLVILLILLAAIVFTAGCAEENQENSTNAPAVQESNGVVEPTESGQNTTQETQEGSSVVEVTDLEQINASLQQGPVLMKIEAENCGTCKAMEPMIQELAAEYEGKVRFISIDMSRSPQLAGVYFGAGYVPDITVIVNIKDGEYVYMQQDGNVITDRFKARITGPREKGIYEDVLNHALIQAEKDKSQ